MNDNELDRLLDTWEAPAPPSSLRKGLRAQFPRPERRRFARPLGWVLVIAVASATLAIGLEQSGENPGDFRIVRVLNRLYENLMEGLETRRLPIIVAHIRQSEPKVYVDGELAGQLEYGPAATMNVQVPGEGLYSITLYRGGLTGWTEAGHLHGNAIEFRAGAKQVRIECNRPIADSDRPVFAMRRP
ncbi:MAG TPA: hypothetical protein VGH38_11580 [Bryobacteraceae bacterium]|jgi:hypothetical protein